MPRCAGRSQVLVRNSAQLTGQHDVRTAGRGRIDQQLRDRYQPHQGRVGDWRGGSVRHQVPQPLFLRFSLRAVMADRDPAACHSPNKLASPSSTRCRVAGTAMKLPIPCSVRARELHGKYMAGIRALQMQVIAGIAACTRLGLLAGRIKLIRETRGRLE